MAKSEIWFRETLLALTEKEVDKKKDISSHLADVFFQIEELKKGHLDQQDLILVKLGKSVTAIAKEVYVLKNNLREATRVIDEM